jgi:hypothetical protein
VYHQRADRQLQYQYLVPVSYGTTTTIGKGKATNQQSTNSNRIDRATGERQRTTTYHHYYYYYYYYNYAHDEEMLLIVNELSLFCMVFLFPSFSSCVVGQRSAEAVLFLYSTVSLCRVRPYSSACPLFPFSRCSLPVPAFPLL